MIASFWWNNCDENRRIHWFSWNKLCLPKCEGGLGLHHFYAFNLALLTKQGWRIMLNPQSLVARVLKAKYFLSSLFMKTSVGLNASYYWRNLYASREVIKRDAWWLFGNGSTVRIWAHPWIVFPSSFCIFFPKPIDCPLEFVGELID